MRLVFLALMAAAALVVPALPALADHEGTHLRCPNDPTRFTPDCAPQVTGTTLPKTAGADGEFAIIGLALIGIGIGLQRRWVLSRRVA